MKRKLELISKKDIDYIIMIIDRLKDYKHHVGVIKYSTQKRLSQAQGRWTPPHQGETTNGINIMDCWVERSDEQYLQELQKQAAKVTGVDKEVWTYGTYVSKDMMKGMKGSKRKMDRATAL